MNSIARDAAILVTGRRGLVGSAVVRRLESAGFTQILAPSRDQLDLCDQRAVDRWFAEARPRYVIHAAGLVGGIQANVAQPADFIYANLLIHATVLRAAHATGVEKLLYLGSSCVYPRDCPQPMREEYLLTGPLEPTNRGYALAKIAGVVSCSAYRKQYGCNFLAAMPTNLYGPNDNFDPQNSHVVAGMIRKFHACRLAGEPKVTLWGTGSPRRELMHVDDCADACLFLMDNYDGEEHINVGTGEDLSIAELAGTIRDVVCPGVELQFDATKPDGPPRKLLDVSRLHELGWRRQTDLRDGIADTYHWFCNHAADVRGAG